MKVLKISFDHLALWGPFSGRGGRDERDGLLPTRDVLADVPYVIRRPCPLAGDSRGRVSGGVVLPELSKILHQEDALGAPCFRPGDACSPQTRPRGAQECCGQA